MNKFLQNDLVLLLLLNTLFSGAVVWVAAPYAWRPSVADFEALHIWRNITFPFAAAMVFGHVALGFHRPRLCWLWYGVALLNYLAYSLFGMVNVPWALWRFGSGLQGLWSATPGGGG